MFKILTLTGTRYQNETYHGWIIFILFNIQDNQKRTNIIRNSLC